VSNASTVILLAPIHFKVTNFFCKTFQVPKALFLNTTSGPSSPQSSAVCFTPNSSHNPQNSWGLVILSDISLRASENTQIRLCKKCSATQYFLLKDGSKKCLVVILTTAHKLNNLMQEIQICFPSSCWGSSNSFVSRETILYRFFHRSAETFSLETFALPPIDAPPVNGKRVKIYWDIQRITKVSVQIYWVFWLVLDF